MVFLLAEDLICYHSSMQIFHLISLLVPIAIAVGLPASLRRCGYANEKSHRWWLYAACILFAISWYLPSPLIEGRDTSFVTHFVGGGIFTALLWIYLKRSLGLNWHWALELAALFGLVSALGAINELAELFLVKTNLATITLDDTNWDILANTLGALLAWLVYKVMSRDSWH